MSGRDVGRRSTIGEGPRPRWHRTFSDFKNCSPTLQILQYFATSAISTLHSISEGRESKPLPRSIIMIFDILTVTLGAWAIWHLIRLIFSRRSSPLPHPKSISRSDFCSIITPIVREFMDEHHYRFANHQSYNNFINSAMDVAWARVQAGTWNVTQFLQELRTHFEVDRQRMFAEGFA